MLHRNPCLRIAAAAFRLRSGVASYSSAQPSTAAPQKIESSTPAASYGKPLPEKIRTLVDQIAGLSLLEVADLNKELKSRLNIPDTPMMSAFGMSMAPTAGKEDEATPKAVPETTKISFNVKLTGYDEKKKIELIKKIRDIVPNLNLVQAKKVVEGVPVDVKTDLGKTEADDLKKALEGVGGKAEVV